MTCAPATSWPHRPAPRPAPQPASQPGPAVLAPAPACAREMSRLRRRVRAAVHDTHPVGAGVTVDPGAAAAAVRLADDLERLDLVLEELASNGQRHGRAPVQVAVHAADGGWVVAVTDAAPDLPPLLVTDRDPAEGGMGLQMAARLADDHGWSVSGGRKTVWALLAPR